MNQKDRCRLLQRNLQSIQAWLMAEAEVAGADGAAATMTAVAARLGRIEAFLEQPVLAILPPSNAVALDIVETLLPQARVMAPKWLRGFEHAVKRLSPMATQSPDKATLRLLSQSEIVRAIVAGVAGCGDAAPATAEELDFLRGRLASDDLNPTDAAIEAAIDDLRDRYLRSPPTDRVRSLTDLGFWRVASDIGPNLGGHTRTELFECLWGNFCRRDEGDRCARAGPGCVFGDLLRGWLQLLARLKHAASVTVTASDLVTPRARASVTLACGKDVSLSPAEMVALRSLTAEVLLAWPSASAKPIGGADLAVFPSSSAVTGLVGPLGIFHRAKVRLLWASLASPLAKIVGGRLDATSHGETRIVVEVKAANFFDQDPLPWPPDIDTAWEAAARQDDGAFRRRLAAEISAKSRANAVRPALDDIAASLRGVVQRFLEADCLATKAMTEEGRKVWDAFASDPDCCDSFSKPALHRVIEVFEVERQPVIEALVHIPEGDPRWRRDAQRFAREVADHGSKAWREAASRKAQTLALDFRELAKVAETVIAGVDPTALAQSIDREVLFHLEGGGRADKETLFLILREGIRRALPDSAPPAKTQDGETAYAGARRQWLVQVATLAEAPFLRPPTSILTNRAGLMVIRAALELR